MNNLTYISGGDVRGRLAGSSVCLCMKQCAAVIIHCRSISAAPQRNCFLPKHDTTRITTKRITITGQQIVHEGQRSLPCISRRRKIIGEKSTLFLLLHAPSAIYGGGRSVYSLILSKKVISYGNFACKPYFASILKGLSDSSFQLSAVKPKPNQLLTNSTSQPISNRSKAKANTKVIA